MQPPEEHGKSTGPGILLADDHSILAEGVRASLSANYEIFGIVSDGRSLVEQAKLLKPTLIVTDIRMPLMNGVDAAEEIRQFAPRTRFVFLTMIDDPNLAAAVMRFAPVGYVLKHSVISELLTAVDEVLKGRSFMTRRMRPDDWMVQKERARMVSKELTPRQRSVLQLLAEGRPMKEIADILQVSEKTVEFHKYQIMKSWSLHSNAQLVLFALKHGLISAQ